MSIQSTDQRITELLALRRKIDAELARLAEVVGAVERTKRSKFDVPDCGSESAYQRHRHYKQPQDDACKTAHAAYERNRAALARERKRAQRLAELRWAA